MCFDWHYTGCCSLVELDPVELCHCWSYPKSWAFFERASNPRGGRMVSKTRLSSTQWVSLLKQHTRHGERADENLEIGLWQAEPDTHSRHQGQRFNVCFYLLYLDQIYWHQTKSWTIQSSFQGWAIYLSSFTIRSGKNSDQWPTIVRRAVQQILFRGMGQVWKSRTRTGSWHKRSSCETSVLPVPDFHGIS